MKTKVFLFVSLLFIALVVCSKDNGNLVTNATPEINCAGLAGEEFALKNFTYTGCKSMTRSRSLSERFELKAVENGGLLVKHVDVMFNCASSRFEAVASIDGQHISVTEYDTTHSDVGANCECPYDLGYEIGPLEEGVTYIMTITTGTDHESDPNVDPEDDEHMAYSIRDVTTIMFIYSSTLDDVISAFYENEGDIYGKWVLDYYTKDGVEVYLVNVPTEGYRCTVEFSEDGKVEVNGGNQMFGNFTLGDKRKVYFSDVHSTERCVIDEDLLFFDEHILTAMSYIAVFDHLLLYYSDTDYFQFSKKETSSIDTRPTKKTPHQSPATYSLQGFKIDSNGHQPSKGIYIQNGKKVVIK